MSTPVTIRRAFGAPYRRVEEFADPFAACRKIYDDFLRAHPGLSADDLDELCGVFCDDPEYLEGFDKYDYRRERIRKCASASPDPEALDRYVARHLAEAGEPVVVTVLNTESQSADDVHAWIHVINPTARAFRISTQAEYFQTVNEDTGAGITVGPKPVERVLEPGTSLEVGDILEWELDTTCEFILVFDSVCKAMSLKSDPSVTCRVPILNRRGRVHRGVWIP